MSSFVASVMKLFNGEEVKEVHDVNEVVPVVVPVDDFKEVDKVVVSSDIDKEVVPVVVSSDIDKVDDIKEVVSSDIDKVNDIKEVVPVAIDETFDDTLALVFDETLVFDEVQTDELELANETAQLANEQTGLVIATEPQYTFIGDECSICSDEITCLHLLVCGHGYHLFCASRIEHNTRPDNPKMRCPLCNDESTPLYPQHTPANNNDPPIYFGFGRDVVRLINAAPAVRCLGICSSRRRTSGADTRCTRPTKSPYGYCQSHIDQYLPVTQTN